MEEVEIKRRLPRRRSRVQITKVLLDGNWVDGKMCLNCGVEKALEEFYSRRSECKICSKECKRKYRETNPEKVRESNRRYYNLNRERIGIGRKTELNTEKKRARWRKWREKNIETERENRRQYRIKCRNFAPEKKRARDRRREATIRNLPFKWNASDEAKLYECRLTQLTGVTHTDHVIPLSWGHGGSYVGNLIPLAANLNVSKNDAHIYEWFEASGKRFGLDRTRFDAMMATLAAQNGLTTDEYRSYYDWCRDNKRDLTQTKRDNETYGYVVSSLELWRAATGMQFPIRIDFDKKPPVARRKSLKRKSRTEANRTT